MMMLSSHRIFGNNKAAVALFFVGIIHHTVAQYSFDNCGQWKDGISLNGHELSHSMTGSAGECCLLCGRTVGAKACTGWTWNHGNHLCYLKTDITGNTSSASVSGGVTPGPALPTPPPSPQAPTPAPSSCGTDPPSTPSALPQCPWYNGSLSEEQRCDALVALLTPQEKLAILAGRGVDRLLVPSDGFNEALHGVAWAGRATVFPCPMLLGATFDDDLVRTIGGTVAKEALAKHWDPRGASNALSFFAPNINIVRDIRWGRAQETYGEDPTLTGRLGVAYVQGMQFLGSANTSSRLAVRNVAKHFAAYNLESNYAGRTSPAEIAQGVGQYRLQYDAHVPQADLLQTYLPAFEDVVRDAKIRGVMCAYNSVDGTPLCANTLMQTELRARMGFDGVVITDCGAIGFMTSTHKWQRANGTAYTPVEVTAASLKAGTDLCCGSAYSDDLPLAYGAGLVNDTDLDRSVRRVLAGYMELGLFQDSAEASKDTRRQYKMSIVDSAPHRALAKKAAVSGTVLLKNRARTLPLGGQGMDSVRLGDTTGMARTSPIKLAVVGPNANRTVSLTSSYSGCRDRAGGPITAGCSFVTPLDGLRSAARTSTLLDSDVLYAPGVDIDTPDTSGISAAVTAAAQADVTVVFGGLITCQENGDECQEAEARDRSTPVDAQGHDDPSAGSTGIGRDYGVGLPGKQLALLQTLANSTNTTIVLVVMSGSAVEVTWAAASPRVGAIVQAFYPGVLGGSALADVLLGVAPPAGKLPVMVPTSESQLPDDYLNQSMQAGMGRTHRYFNGTPLFPFGYGLGYSTFTYGDLKVSHTVLPAGAASAATTNGTVVQVSVAVTNNGEYAAGPSEEIVLVFARPQLSQPPSPAMSVPKQMLLGFTKVSVQPGETLSVVVAVPSHRLRLLGQNERSFELLPGRYELHVGGRAPGSSVGMPAPQEGRPQQPLTASLLVQ